MLSVLAYMSNVISSEFVIGYDGEFANNTVTINLLGGATRWNVQLLAWLIPYLYMKIKLILTHFDSADFWYVVQEICLVSFHQRNFLLQFCLGYAIYSADWLDY